MKSHRKKRARFNSSSATSRSSHPVKKRRLSPDPAPVPPTENFSPLSRCVRELEQAITNAGATTDLDALCETITDACTEAFCADIAAELDMLKISNPQLHTVEQTKRAQKKDANAKTAKPATKTKSKTVGVPAIEEHVVDGSHLDPPTPHPLVHEINTTVRARKQSNRSSDAEGYDHSNMNGHIDAGRALGKKGRTTKHSLGKDAKKNKKGKGRRSSKGYVEEVVEDEGRGDVDFDATFDNPEGTAMNGYHKVSKTHHRRRKSVGNVVEEEILDQSDPMPPKSKSRRSSAPPFPAKSSIGKHKGSHGKPKAHFRKKKGPHVSKVVKRVTTTPSSDELPNQGNGHHLTAKHLPGDVSAASPKRARSAAPRIPWWRIPDGTQFINKGDMEVLKIFVTTFVRATTRLSWSANNLRESFQKDPRSTKGEAFTAISTVMSKLENERNTGELLLNWPQELFREVQERQHVKWSDLKYDSTFIPFVGCEACLKHRKATCIVSFSGLRYDSLCHWPQPRSYSIVSSQKQRDGSLLVEAALKRTPSNGKGQEQCEEKEFWVDEQCLRRILAFHEICHAPIRLNSLLNDIVEKLLNQTVVRLKSSSKLAGDRNAILDRLQRFLVKQLVNDDKYLHDTLAYLVNIIRLGDWYFVSSDINSTLSARTIKTDVTREFNIYSPRINLADYDFKDIVDEVLERLRVK